MAHGKSIETGPAGLIVGIVNVTPDSFSDGGQYFDQKKAIAHARQLVDDGAIMVDIGGESSRPGAEPVSAEREQSRVLPVIEALAGEGGPLISIDTWRAETARLAIEAGAHVLNDIWGLHKGDELAAIAARTGAGLVIMHNGRDRDRDEDVITDQYHYLTRSLEIADGHGLPPEQIVLDPGFGFAKSPDENLRLLARLDGLHTLGYPLMAGTSRKRFIGHATGRQVQERDVGTAATSVVARLKGAALFRVHDVSANRDAIAVADAVLNAGCQARTPARSRTGEAAH